MGLHTFSDTTCAKYISTNTPPGVGADLSRPTIIKEEHMQIPQNL